MRNKKKDTKKNLKDKFKELEIKDEKPKFQKIMDKVEYFNSLVSPSSEESEFEEIFLDNATGLRKEKEESYA